MSSQDITESLLAVIMLQCYYLWALR